MSEIGIIGGLMNNKNEKGKQSVNLSYQAVRGVAIVAGAFSLIVCILIIANYLQLKAVDPLNSPALTRLREKLEENPKDEELKEEIRAIDLLARKAYFTSRWQIRTGGFMLLAGVALLLVCLKVMSELRPRLPEPGRAGEAESLWRSKGLARKLVAAGGALLLLVALIFTVFSSIELTGKDLFTLSRIRWKAREEEGSGLNGEIEPEIKYKPIPEDASGFPSQEELFENWPSFRGPGGNAVAGHDYAPVFWDGITGDGILWKAAVLKPGLNSPIIWQDLLFISGADEDGQEVYCFDRHTGEIIWTREVKDIPGSPAEPPEVSEDTGLAAPTMTTDGRRVFAIFPTGDIVSFDFEGSRVWAKNLGVPENHYGHASSLIMYKNRLLVQYDGAAEAKLIALDAATGETAGEITREVMTSWASPIVVNTGSRFELILNATPLVVSYDPETGEELWSVECLMGEVGPSPAYADGIVFAVNQYALLAAINIETKQIVWEAYDDLPDAPCPLATDRFLILPTSYGVVTCFNAKNGDIYWTHEFDKGFYSSPILVGDKVYLMDRSGVTHIFMAGEEFVSLGDPQLGERSDTTPAFKDGRIYIRGKSHLFCIGNQDEQQG